MTIDQAIKDKTKILEHRKRQLSLLKTLRDESNLHYPIRCDSLSDRVYYIVHTLDQLQNCRHELRDVWGGWEDNLTLVFGSPNNRAIAMFDCVRSEYPQNRLGIFLVTTPEEFPPELIKEGCGFKKSVVSVDTLEFSCKA